MSFFWGQILNPKTSFFFGAEGVLVGFGPEGGRRHNSPMYVTLLPLSSRGYFYYYRREKETRKNLTEQEMQQGNT
jgi:hypothetical protein